MSKGKSVCERHVIRQDVLETFVIDEIGQSLQEVLGQTDSEVLQELMKEYIDAPQEGFDDELAKLRERESDIRRKVNNILDNITAGNREFADERIREFKCELRETEPRLAELERAVGMKVDIEKATEEMLGFLREFDKVLAGGSIDERRRVIRAFVKEIRLDPQTNESQALLFNLPEPEGLTQLEPATSDSSFRMVAGARFGTLCNWGGMVIERYVYEAGTLRKVA